MRMYPSRLANLLSYSLLVCDGWWTSLTIGIVEGLLSGDRKMTIFHSHAATTAHLRSLRYWTNRGLIMSHNTAHGNLFEVGRPSHLWPLCREGRNHWTLSATFYFVLISSANWCVEKVHRWDLVLEHTFARKHSADRWHGRPNIVILRMSIGCLCEIRIIVHS